MNVLFSPIGNSDPWRNDHDGAMLHIVRKYKPEVVELFFTKSLWESGHKDYRWDSIIKEVSPKAKVNTHVVEIGHVNGFDSYKDAFHERIEKLHNTYPKDDVLLNITSGVPQMQATLALEYVTFPNHKKLIQVSTPQKGSNYQVEFASPDTQESDLEFIQFVENEEDVVDRTYELEILSFKQAMIRAQLTSMLDNYDYSGARSLLESERGLGLDNRKTILNILKVMEDDINGNRIFEEVHKEYKGRKFKQAFSQFLILDMFFKRNNLADVLIRAQSIAEFILKEYIHQQYRGFIIEDGLPKVNPNYKGDLLEKYYRKLESKNVQRNVNLGIQSYIDILEIENKNEKLVDAAKTVDGLRSKRNAVAHDLKEVYVIGDEAEESLRELITAVKTILRTMYTDIKEKSFYYFDSKNAEILDLFDGK